MPDQPPPAHKDAVEAPPWDPARKPGPRITTYDRLTRPRLRIRVDGVWRDARVQQRQDWPDGRIRVQCEVYLPIEGGYMSWLVRGYWWDTAAMRPVRPRPR
ncbi:hypothetical protein [Actinacidiphila glaucinigra]|uniref:hypothetical protein n=1 Tax=Actinacidiphila glaucinigra TaxID=235986 RepID=UPI0035DEB5A7